MPINILMPALSPTMEKGNLAKWLKKEGDTVKSGDVIAEIETDKATMEVEAVDEGTLAKIVVPEGTADVPVNQVIAVLAGEGEDVKAAAAGAGQAAPRAEAASRRAAPQPPSRSRAEGRSAEAAQPRRQPRRAASRAAPQPVGGGRVFASPLAGGSPRKPASTSRASRAPARTAASSRATSRRRSPARACKPRRRAGAPRRRLRRRAVDVGRSRSARCSRRAATRSCRTTACAAPSRSG